MSRSLVLYLRHLKNVATLAKLRKKILLKIRSLKDPILPPVFYNQSYPLPPFKNARTFNHHPLLSCYLSFPTIVSPKGRILAGQEEAVNWKPRAELLPGVWEANQIQLIQNQICSWGIFDKPPSSFRESSGNHKPNFKSQSNHPLEETC